MKRASLYALNPMSIPERDRGQLWIQYARYISKDLDIITNYGTYLLIFSASRGKSVRPFFAAIFRHGKICKKEATFCIQMKQTNTFSVGTLSTQLLTRIRYTYFAIMLTKIELSCFLDMFFQPRG